MQQLWNMWWAKYSLIDLKANPYYTDFIYHPYEVSLAFHVYVFLNSVLSIPLQYVIGLPAIYNIFVFLSFVLSGFGFFLLANHFVNDRRAAFIGGVYFAFLHHTHTGNLGMIHWIPLYIFFLVKSTESADGYRKYALAAGVFLAFNFLSEYLYFIFMVLFTAVYALFILMTRRSRFPELIKRGLYITVSCIPLMLPTLIAVFHAISSGNVRTVPPGSGVDTNVADLLGFLSPHPDNFILGGLSFSHKFTGLENYAYAGLGLTVLCSLGWLMYRRLDRRVNFWLAALSFFLLISLGPWLHVLGKEYPVPLPFKIFSYIPLLDNLRSPVRFHLLTMFCASVLASYGMKYLFDKKNTLLWLLVPLTAVELMAFSYPTNDCSIPPVYREIAEDREAQTVLEIPFFVRDGFNYLARTVPVTPQYYQTLHHKKLFNGYIARVAPEHLFLSYLNLPVLRTLAAIEMNLPVREATLEVDKRLSPIVMDLFGVDYAVVHKKYQVSGAHGFLKYAVRMKKVFEDSEITAYKIIRTPGDRLSINAGTESSIPYLFRGWINGQIGGDIPFAWMRGEESVLFINLTPGEDYTFSIRLRPHPSLREKGLRVLLNGEPLTELETETNWEEYSFSLPAQTIRSGLNRIMFRPSGGVSADENFGGVWTSGALVEYLRQMYLPNQKDDEIVILDWEQDNSKFKNATISFAVDNITVTPQLNSP